MVTSPFTNKVVELILFIAALFIIAAWVGRHLSNFEWLLVATAIFNILYTVVGQLMRYSSDDEESALKRKVRSMISTCLQPRVLVILYTLILTVGNMVSTVTVYADGISEELNVNLSAEGKKPSRVPKTLNSSNELVVFAAITSPFGRSFYLEAPGYLRHSFDLYPWVGRRIRVRQDLTPMPTLLLRFLTKPKSIAGGKLRLSIGQDSLEFQIPSSGANGSVLVGRERQIPDEWVSRWERNLYAETPADLDPMVIRPAVVDFILGWTDYAHVNSPLEITPGSTVAVSVINGAGNEVFKESLLVSGDRFQDFLLRPLDK